MSGLWISNVPQNVRNVSQKGTLICFFIRLYFRRHDESKIRKAYFRLAQKYHPDKNPDGRVSVEEPSGKSTSYCMKTLNSFVSNSLFCQDIFEKVNKAYEFLCTKSARIIDGPDPENIILILKAQSILFNRHRQGVKIDPDLFLVHFFKMLFNLLTCALSRDRTGALQIRWLSHAHQNN